MSSLSCLSHVKRVTAAKERPPAPTIYTDVVWCGDRSGSMSSMQGSSEEQAENFMKEHKENAKKMNNIIGYHVDFTTFDDEANTYYSGDAKIISKSDISRARDAMVPRGSTRFYDTAIECLEKQRERLIKVKDSLSQQQKKLYYENSHLINAVFATFTDGYDNQSKYTDSDLKEEIKRQEEEFDVVCMFLAANLSADECGERFGFQKEFCMQMGSDRVSSGNALRSCSLAMTRAVTQGREASQFTPLERDISAPNNRVGFNNIFVTPPRITRDTNMSGILRQSSLLPPPNDTPPTIPSVPLNSPSSSPFILPSPSGAASAAMLHAIDI